MKTLKFSGREISILRAIDFATGTIGTEILMKTRIEAPDALDILNALLDSGFIETNPSQTGHVELKDLEKTIFEVNPAYAHELKKLFIR